MYCKTRLIVTIVCITTSVLLLDACSQKEEAPPPQAPTVVSTETVTESQPQTAARYSSVVRPFKQVDAAFNAGGYIDSIFMVPGKEGGTRVVEPGDFVRVGTILAAVRPAEFESRVLEQNAAIEEARQSVKRAQGALEEVKTVTAASRETFGRTSRLFRTDSITKPEYDSAKNDLAVNEARVREAQEQIAVARAGEARMRAAKSEAQVSLRNCSLKAPIDGVVLKRNVEQGSLVTQGTVAFTLADTDTVKVEFGVPDVELSALSIGQPISISADAVPGAMFHGRISQIAPAADPSSRVFNVEVTIPNKDGRLKVGMVASLTSGNTTAQKKRLTVPLSAVVRSSRDPNAYSVFVLKQDGGKSIVQEQPVTLGEAFGQMVVIEKGLESGSNVVTNGSTRIANGQEVTVADSTTSDTGSK